MRVSRAKLTSHRFGHPQLAQIALSKSYKTGALRDGSSEASTGRDPAPPDKSGTSADLGAGRESVVLRSSSEEAYDLPAAALNRKGTQELRRRGLWVPSCARFSKMLSLILAVSCPSALLLAASSTAWETASYADYLNGRFSGVSLSSDGILRPGSPLLWEATLGQPALWSMALASDGNAYAATGHGGKVFRVQPNGRSTMVWNSGLSEVFAVAADAQGNVWAGSSPNGGVYRLNGSRPEEIWHSPDKYIWAIQPASDGSLYVATGESGKIYRLEPNGKASVFYETGQSNVTALALSKNSQVYAGTEPNGLIFEISPERKGTILYDSSLPEIRAIAVDPSGVIYAAAMGGALSTRSSLAVGTNAASAVTAVTAATPTVITVTEGNTQSGAKIADTARSGAANTAKPLSTATSTTVTEVAGVEKSAIYKVALDHSVETLKSSKEFNVYDLILDGTSLLYSTDDSGRIYRWQDGKSTLLAELGTGETTRIKAFSKGLLASVSNPARLVALGPDTAPSVGKNTWYESQVHDSGSVARWGHILWRPSGSKGIGFRTRTGNAQRPDATWSEWSAATGDAKQPAIASPLARFIQWRAEWTGNSGAELNSVSLSYLPRNSAPAVQSLTVTSVLGANAAKNAATAANSTAAYSITVTDTGESSAESTTAGPSQTASRLQTTQTQVTWQADDPDNDKLLYSLYFRPENARDWQFIRSHIFGNTLLLDPDVLADGRYYFKLIASDEPANAAAYAKHTDFVSASVLVDNTPPAVTVIDSRRSGTDANVTMEAVDQTSALKNAEYSVDAGWWQPVEATDGITDTPKERFRIQLDKLRPGEHLVVLRVYDAAGNAGLAKVLLK